MDTKEWAIIVDEYLNGERTILQIGPFPPNKEFKFLFIKKKWIRPHPGKNKRNKEVTLAEVCKLKEDANCKNKEAVETFLEVLEEIKENKNEKDR